jgi:hypothetical protein
MEVNLSKMEVEMLDEALDTWEEEASRSALMSMMMTAVFSAPEERDGAKNKCLENMDRARREQQQRRLKAALLRAKLLQALARESEHAE